MNSFEHLVQELQVALHDYREKVEKLSMNPSDRKKVLALPFYLSKRSQQPEPRSGQAEYNLFNNLTGTNWYADSRTITDPENKLTEFDYENYIDPLLLNKNINDSGEFKRLLRVLNVFTKTEHEKL